MVHRAKGDVQMKAGQVATEQLLPCIADDPELPTRRALEAILVTLGRLVGHSAEYKNIPHLVVPPVPQAQPDWVDGCVQ